MSFLLVNLIEANYLGTISWVDGPRLLPEYPHDFVIIINKFYRKNELPFFRNHKNCLFFALFFETITPFFIIIIILVIVNKIFIMNTISNNHLKWKFEPIYYLKFRENNEIWDNFELIFNFFKPEICVRFFEIFQPEFCQNFKGQKL